MNLKNIGIASLLLVASSSVNAGIIFSDNFESYTTGGTILNWDGGVNWDVDNGSVDLVGSGDYGITCMGGTGHCVDLDGSTGLAGDFVSMNLGPLGAGNYTLSYWVSGNQRGGGDFTVGAVLQDTWMELAAETFSLAADADWELHTLSFTLTQIADPINIYFHNKGGDNVGMLLDDVMLAVPEPSILALFGLGLAGLGFAARKKKQA